MTCTIAEVFSREAISRRSRWFSHQVTILYDDQHDPYAGELRECEFLAAVAEELVRRRSSGRYRVAPERQAEVTPFDLLTRSFGVAPDYPPRGQHVYQLFERLLALRDVVIGSGGLGDWLEQTFPGSMGEGGETRRPCDEIVSDIADRFDEIAGLQATVRVPASIAPEPAGFVVPPGAVLPPELIELASSLAERAPADAVPSDTDTGNYVHALLQRHYTRSRPEHCVLTEVRLSGPCGGGARTVRPAGRYGDPDLAAWAFALATSLRHQRRPDIADLTTREVWEIKPRAEILEGLVELWACYLNPVNDVLNRLPLAGHRGNYTPGTSWRPFTFYALPGQRIARIHSNIPGLLYYDVLRAGPRPREIPVLHPQMDPVLATVVALALLLNPVPGDEVAALPMLGL